MKRTREIEQSADHLIDSPPQRKLKRRWTDQEVLQPSSVATPSRQREGAVGKLAPARPRTPPRSRRLPLTCENLHKLDFEAQRRTNKIHTPSEPSVAGTSVDVNVVFAHAMPGPGPRTGSRSPTKGSTKSSQGGFKLRCFSIHYGGRQQPLPLQLRDLVTRFKERTDPETPSAARIAQRSAAVAKMTEANGKQLLRAHLVPKSAMEGDDAGGVPQLDVSMESNLDPIFLPEHVDSAAKTWFDKLETPRPDNAVGYLRRHLADAMHPRLSCAFTHAQERHFAPFDVCREVAFPFITYEYKSPISSGTIAEAEQQASRGASAIVNSMYQFLRAADPDKQPGVDETSHISITCDMRTVVVWIHWREVDEDGNVTYEMEKVAQSFCDDETALRGIRDVIKNVTEYGMTTRLSMIRQASEQLAAGSNSAASSAPASVLSLSRQEKLVSVLPSPVLTSTSSGSQSISASSPPKKRARVESPGTVGKDQADVPD